MGATQDQPKDVEFVNQLFSSLADLALGDIDRAIKGRCMLGAVILTACFIDYLSLLRAIVLDNKSKLSKRYIDFVQEYLNIYPAKELYHSLRGDLVHAYTGQGCFCYVDGTAVAHFKQTVPGGKIIINVETFVEDVKRAFTDFRERVMCNSEYVRRIGDACRDGRITFMVVSEISWQAEELSNLQSTGRP